MWLTCQMGVDVPSDESAWIRVGTEKKHWKNGKTMVYDTTVSESRRFCRIPKHQSTLVSAQKSTSPFQNTNSPE
jgi:hypothetical protein